MRFLPAPRKGRGESHGHGERAEALGAGQPAGADHASSICDAQWSRDAAA